MSKTMLVLLVVAFVAIATVLAALSHRKGQSSDMPELVGVWQSWRSSFRISKRDGRYEIQIENRNGFLGGRYSGIGRSGTLELIGPLSALCHEMTYVREADQLEFCGEEFQRADSGQGSTGSGGSTPTR